MLTWLIQNLGTILVTLALIFIVTRIILHLRKEKKQGCSSCGGNCSHCSACKACHQGNSRQFGDSVTEPVG